MLLPVYQRPAVTIHRGQGAYLWDTGGRRYLDFTSGVGVNALGHHHPRVTQAILDQAANCLHTSNLYQHAYQQPLAEKLAKWSGLDYVFFSNSGAEAMECALKAAKARGRHRLIALKNGFHGRTMGALSATSESKYREPFGPLLPGVTFVAANDIAELRAAMSGDVAAIVAETVQGEGGVHELKEPYLREIQDLAQRCEALWIADETQCGLGRTGFRFAFQRRPGLQPDIVVTAKPLAAGLPMGATMLSRKAAGALTAGRHGSTFGGGPLVCRVALTVLDAIDEMLPAIQETGAYLRRRLQTLRNLPQVAEIRSAGLLAGIELTTPGAPIVEAALRRGLMLNCTQGNVIRLLPPYIVTREQIDEAVATIRAVVSEGDMDAVTQTAATRALAAGTHEASSRSAS